MTGEVARRTGVALGVDGGGTKTLAVLADRGGRVLGWGRAGCCDIYSNPHGAVGEVEQAVAAALAAANLTQDQVAFATFSLTGADWPEDFDVWRAALDAKGWAGRFAVVNDAIGALASHSAEGDAVIVVCGTGAAVGSRNAATGATWHSSFWQMTEGGGEISRRALRAVYRAHLGIDPPTGLTEPVLAHLSSPSVEALLHRFTAREHRAARKPNDLVPLVFAQAEAGDAAARRILDTHGRKLAAYVDAAARQVGISETPFDLVLAGGVFRAASTLLKDSLLAEVASLGEHIRLVPSAHQPLRGAVLLALRDAFGETGPAALARLDETFPPLSLFDTGLNGEGRRTVA